MTSADSQNPVPLLLRGLSQRLLTVLIGAFRFGLVTGRGMTVDVFLALLYKSFPAEIAPFFSETGTLERLVLNLSSIDLSAHEIAHATAPGDLGKMLLSEMDHRLVELLSQAAKSASTIGGGRADVADFMQVLGNDAETVALLQTERGLIFRNYPT